MTTTAELGNRIPEELVEEFLKRLTYVSEGIHNIQLLEGANRIKFDLRPGFETEAALVASQISEVAGKLCSSHQPGIPRTLARQEVLPTSFHDDPHPLLAEQGEIIAFGRGRFGFGPKMSALMEYFDLRIRRMATKFYAETRTFPSLIGADALDRCRYLKNFPSSLNLVSHLREDHTVLQNFARSVQWDGERLTYDRASASDVECLLSPSVCFHWYMWLRDSKLSASRAITALGKCFRYESNNLKGLERLWDFSMREIILVGTSEYVQDQRRRLTELCVDFLDELGIAYEISSATDPFFVDSYAIQAAYQQGFELKHELLAPLPYSGKRLAIGSINYHQDFFGRSFGIQAGEGAAHTGCLGFGCERLALAFLAQYGVKEENWPDAVIRGLTTAGSVCANV